MVFNDTRASNNTTNNTTPINTTPNTGNSTQHNTTNITAAKAEELAAQYVGMGVELETPTLTTY